MRSVCLLLAIASVALGCRYGTVSIPEWPGQCWIFQHQPEFRDGQYLKCMSEPGSMISIHNAQQNAILLKYAKQAFPDGKIYLGLENVHAGRDLGWIWPDGTPTDYINWAQGSPALGTACAVLNPDGTWSSNACDQKLPTICQAR
ncbi:unnamed protein product, partial [Mesorhabditis spiculigera]